MLININDSCRPELIACYYNLKRLRYSDMDKSDFFDYFEHVCVPQAVDSLSGKAFKCYQGKLGELNKNYEKICSSAASDHMSEKRMYQRIKQMTESYKKFINTAFEGFPSLDMTPIDYLIDAEYSCIVARTIYNKNNTELEFE